MYGWGIASLTDVGYSKGMRYMIRCMGQQVSLARFALLAAQRACYGYGDQASLESAGL